MDTCASTRLMPWRLPAVLAVAMSVGGCVVGPNYHRPDVTPPKDFRSQVAPAEAGSLADLPWWQVFNDKALQGLITQALAGNYDLKVAVARIEQARQQVNVARADYWPQVGYQANAAREKSFIPLPQLQGNVTYNSFEAAISAAWEADVWGRIRRSRACRCGCRTPCSSFHRRISSPSRRRCFSGTRLSAWCGGL